MGENRPSPDRIMSIGLGFWASKALLSAVEIGLFTELSRGPADLAELMSRLDLHPRSARDFMDALVALGFLQRADGKYSNTPDTDRFLDKRKPSYIGGFLEMSSVRLFNVWSGLTTALRTGKPQKHINEGSDFFGSAYDTPEELEEFLKAMTGGSRGGTILIARKFLWAGYKTFVDVGTAQGDLAVQIALTNSHLTGVGFDLPQVKPFFEEYVEQNGLKDRITFAAGDFFKDNLPKADVVLMGHILHDWDLEQKRALIRKAYEALPKGGACIVYETLIDDDRSKNSLGLLMSLNMLLVTPGGFDYTGADCMGWMKEAGFSEARVEPLGGPDSMVIAIK